VTHHKSISTLMLVFTLLLALDAHAQGSCVFYAADSKNHNGPDSTAQIYSDGPISFVWEPSSGRIWGGYHPARVTAYTPVLTYFNNVNAGYITAGPINPSNLNLSMRILFSRSVPDGYWWELREAKLTGTTASATLSGMADGPFLFTATGTVTCN